MPKMTIVPDCGECEHCESSRGLIEGRIIWDELYCSHPDLNNPTIYKWKNQWAWGKKREWEYPRFDIPQWCPLPDAPECCSEPDSDGTICLNCGRPA